MLLSISDCLQEGKHDVLKERNRHGFPFTLKTTSLAIPQLRLHLVRTSQRLLVEAKHGCHTILPTMENRLPAGLAIAAGPLSLGPQLRHCGGIYTESKL